MADNALSASNSSFRLSLTLFVLQIPCNLLSTVRTRTVAFWNTELWLSHHLNLTDSTSCSVCRTRAGESSSSFCSGRNAYAAWQADCWQAAAEVPLSSGTSVFWKRIARRRYFPELHAYQPSISDRHRNSNYEHLFRSLWIITRMQTKERVAVTNTSNRQVSEPPGASTVNQSRSHRQVSSAESLFLNRRICTVINTSNQQRHKSVLLYSKLHNLVSIVTSPNFILQASNALSDTTMLTNPNPLLSNAEHCRYNTHLRSIYFCFHGDIN
jgi:hypothetical protein